MSAAAGMSHTEEDAATRFNDPGGASTALSALVVNNCAAATFLALNTLAEGGEVIVSRGELVEIGGGYRMPRFSPNPARSYARWAPPTTRLADYEGAISTATRLILRVHQSNFSMEGFVERPALRDLVSLGKHAKTPILNDREPGLIASLESLGEPLGIASQSTLPESVQVGSDLIAASGDKLLGGPQCGLLIGRAELVQSVRKNPLYRTYRVDKLTYAALEATLMDYASQKDSGIPVQKMLKAAAGEIFERCEWVSRQVNCAELAAESVPVQSLIGGGTAPDSPGCRAQPSLFATRYCSRRRSCWLFAGLSRRWSAASTKITFCWICARSNRSSIQRLPPSCSRSPPLLPEKAASSFQT